MGPLSLTEEGSGAQREELPLKVKMRSKEYILGFKSRKNNHQFQIYPHGNPRRGMSSSPFADGKTEAQREAHCPRSQRLAEANFEFRPLLSAPLPATLPASRGKSPSCAPLLALMEPHGEL